MTTNNTAIAAKLRELADLFDRQPEAPAPSPAAGWGTAQPATTTTDTSKPWEVPCPKCGGILRVVPAGVSKSSGKPYREFIGCSTCDYTANIAQAAPMA